MATTFVSTTRLSACHSGKRHSHGGLRAVNGLQSRARRRSLQCPDIHDQHRPHRPHVDGERHDRDGGNAGDGDADQRLGRVGGLAGLRCQRSAGRKLPAMGLCRERGHDPYLDGDSGHSRHVRVPALSQRRLHPGRYKSNRNRDHTHPCPHGKCHDGDGGNRSHGHVERRFWRIDGLAGSCRRWGAGTSYLQWTYVGPGVKTRTWNVTPPGAGTYQFRLFLNDGYTRSATSPTITVSN